MKAVASPPDAADASSRDPPMRRVRVIPTLLIDGHGRLVKTVRFGKRTYIGDPINAVKIFNTKEVDELVLLDIDASREDRAPNYALIEDIVGEAFMPVGYGGGIASMEHIARLYKCGIEKVVLSSALQKGGVLIAQAAQRYGAQAITVCLQVKKPWIGARKVYTHSATRCLGIRPAEAARTAVAAGAGEIIVYSVDRDGTFTGYDTALLADVAASVSVPVVACGGARGVKDLAAAVRDGHASAVAAGSMFVYQSERRGVLISYPTQAILKAHVFPELS
jgi:cyclase